MLTDLDSPKDLITVTLGRLVTPKVAQASEVVDEVCDVMTLGRGTFPRQVSQGSNINSILPSLYLKIWLKATPLLYRRLYSSDLMEDFPRSGFHPLLTPPPRGEPQHSAR